MATTKHTKRRNSTRRRKIKKRGGTANSLHNFVLQILATENQTSFKMDWQSLIQNLFSFSIVVSAISWVAKKIGDHYLERRFAAYEKELELNQLTNNYSL